VNSAFAIRPAARLPSQEKKRIMEQRIRGTSRRDPWNKGQLAGQKTPFKLKDICAIRVLLQLAARTPDSAIGFRHRTRFGTA